MTLLLTLDLRTRILGSRRLPWVAAGVLACTWITSLFWNTMRFRESVRGYRYLSTAPVTKAMKDHIPPGTPVFVSPQLFTMAAQAHLNYTPFPMWQKGFDPPPSAWLVISESEWKTPFHLDPDSLKSRQVVFNQSLYPDIELTGENIVIFGAENSTAASTHAFRDRVAGLPMRQRTLRAAQDWTVTK